MASSAAVTDPLPRGVHLPPVPTKRRCPDASLPFPHLRRPHGGRCRHRCAPVRLVQPHPRPWRRVVHRCAGPLRHHPMRGRPRLARVRRGGDTALGVGGPHRWRRAAPSRRDRELRHADGLGRGLRPRHRGAGTIARAAAAGRDRPGISRGDAAPLSLPRSPARAAARQHHAARPCHRQPARPHEGAGLLRVPDPDPHRFLARGRARLPRAEPRAPGQVLRAAAGAPAVQAADHGGGFRPLLPDRPVFPRRGRPRRPLPGRVLPARHRDELRHPGGRVRGGGARAARRFRGIRRGTAGHPAVPHDRLQATPCCATASTSPTCATRC